MAPGTSMFIHWLVGMVYVFYFASFILLLREVLRPGVLWFLRNLNDPDFNPVQEVSQYVDSQSNTQILQIKKKEKKKVIISHCSCCILSFLFYHIAFVSQIHYILPLLTIFALYFPQMIHLPIVRHTRRFLASMVIFGSTVLLMLWLPIKIIHGLWPSFLPYHITLSR